MSTYFEKTPAPFDFGIMRFEQVDEFIDGHHIRTYWEAKPVSEGGNADQYVTIEMWGEGYLTTIFDREDPTKEIEDCGPFDTIRECVRAAECKVCMTLNV